jgi:hypothetical protein
VTFVNDILSKSVLGRTPGDETWAALESAVVRVAAEMVAQAMTSTVWSYATLGRMPGEETWAALETAAVRVAAEMKPQEVSNLVWGYATLDRTPREETWTALEAAAGRVAPDMTSQGLANTLLAYATLPTLRGVELPSCYAAVWDKVCGLEAGAFSDEGLCMLFHAHLMHKSFDTNRSVKVAYPAWLMVEARDAWMRDVEDTGGAGGGVCRARRQTPGRARDG